MKFLMLVLCLSAASLVSRTALSQDMSLGEFEYNNSCVACHGPSGKGDGPVSGFLSGPLVPNLTVLQKNNGGVFPVSAVYEVIDGREDVGAHGTREMPIWGRRFRERLDETDEDAFFSPEEKVTYARVRILALVDYLASIQEQ